MKKCVLDTTLWIEYLLSSEVGKKVAKVIEDPHLVIIVPLLQLAELHYIVLKSFGEDAAVEFTSTLLSETVIDVGDPQTYLYAAELRAKYLHDLTLSECLLVATSKKFNATLIVRDEVYQSLKYISPEVGIEVKSCSDLT